MIDGREIVYRQRVEIFSRLAQCVKNRLGKIMPGVMTVDLCLIIRSHENYALRQWNALAMAIAINGKINPIRITAISSRPSSV